MYSTIRQMTLILACFLPTVATYTTLTAGEEEIKGTARQLSKEFASIARKAMPAVVSIRTKFAQRHSSRSEGWDERLPFDPNDFWQRFFGYPSPPQERRGVRMGLGSGFLISPDGYILSNNHVIDGAEQITVIFNGGDEFTAKVIGSDPSTDVALLKIEATNLPYISLGDSDDIEVGELVMAIGNSLGLQATCTVGIISAIGRNDLGIAGVEEFFQTDAAINQGNSGGPLLNFRGYVVGMNTAIASNTGGNVGVGFAIPSNFLKPISEQLRTTGHVVRGYFGITLQKIDAKLAQAFNLEKNEGALISDVVKESPADKAGLKSGDVVLLINNKAIKNPGMLKNTISFMKPGQKANLSVMRNKQLVSISVVVGTHPEVEQAAGSIQKKLGFTVQELTAEKAQKLGYEPDRGVLIQSVDPASNAYEIGLRKGLLILSVGTTPVNSVDEFYRIVQQNISQKRILFLIKAGEVTNYVYLDLN